MSVDKLREWVDSVQELWLCGEPVMSVGMPAYSVGEVVWLALAGLSRQEEVPVPWEIVICQEDDSVDEVTIRKYEAALRASGCVRLVLVQLTKWIHLSQKWCVIREHLGKSSKIFLLQGSDDYPHKVRLKSSWEALQDGSVDWFHWTRMLFYDFNFDTWSIFKGEEKPPLSVPKMGWERHPCGPNMATRTEYLNFLNCDEEVRRGVDGWIFFSIQAGLGRKPNIREGNLDEQETGFGTTGFNTLSASRMRHGRKPLPPIVPCEGDLSQFLTESEVLQVKNLASTSRLRAIHALMDELDQKDKALNSFKAFYVKYKWVRRVLAPVFKLKVSVARFLSKLKKAILD